jgi:hypothetical protein
MASNARYLVTDDDLVRLIAMLEKDPRRGNDRQGSPREMSETEQGHQNTAHRFYNYQIHEWIRSIRGQ